MFLWSAAIEKGYAAPIWMTFKQALELKAHVRKVSRGALAYAFRKSNSHIQMKSAKKWRRQNATNGMYCSRRRRVLVD
jgi:antirestriction protein ArdC